MGSEQVAVADVVFILQAAVFPFVMMLSCLIYAVIYGMCFISIVFIHL